MAAVAETAMKTVIKGFQTHEKGKQVTGIINGLPTTNKYLGPVIKKIQSFWQKLEKFNEIKEEVKKQAVIMKKDGEEKVKTQLDNFKTEFQNGTNKDIIKELNPSIMTIINPLPGITGSLIKFIIDNSTEPKVTSKNLYDEFLKIGNKAIEAAKKAEAEKKKKEAAAAAAKKAAAAAAAAADTTKTTKTTTTATQFGKRKRGPSASLKRMCKKHGVRLMVKRGKTRVYKSSKVLKEQCQRKLKNKLKKNKKKNFGRKKIKRSGIMPPKRKTRGKKKRRGGAKLASTLKASAKRQAKRARKGASSAARYARRNPGYAAAGLAGLGALGLGGFEAKRARGRYLLDRKAKKMAQNPYAPREAYTDYQAQRKALESPTGRFVRGVRDYDYRGAPRRAYTGATTYPYRQRAGEFYTGAKAAPGAAYTGARTGAGKAYSGFMDLFKRKKRPVPDMGVNLVNLYGKRRRRRRRKKSSFGKKAKKPSAALKKMCKKHKVRLTLKRGGKRVYKSEAMLKKQCKTAMKKKKKK